MERLIVEFNFVDFNGDKGTAVTRIDCKNERKEITDYLKRLDKRLRKVEILTVGNAR